MEENNKTFWLNLRLVVNELDRLIDNKLDEFVNLEVVKENSGQMELPLGFEYEVPKTPKTSRRRLKNGEYSYTSREGMHGRARVNINHVTANSLRVTHPQWVGKNDYLIGEPVQKLILKHGNQHAIGKISDII